MMTLTKNILQIKIIRTTMLTTITTIRIITTITILTTRIFQIVILQIDQSPIKLTVNVSC